MDTKTIKTAWSNMLLQKKSGYNTQGQNTAPAGIVQLILSSIELFPSESFVGLLKGSTFGHWLSFFFGSTEDKI